MRGEVHFERAAQLCHFGRDSQDKRQIHAIPGEAHICHLVPREQHQFRSLEELHRPFQGQCQGLPHQCALGHQVRSRAGRAELMGPPDIRATACF